nr:hypothetical protein [Pseudomonadota bacterium]
YSPVFTTSRLRTTAYYDDEMLIQYSQFGELEKVALEMLITKNKGIMSRRRLVEMCDKASSPPNISSLAPNFIRFLFYKTFNNNLVYLPRDNLKEIDCYSRAIGEIYARFITIFFTPNYLLYLIYLHSYSYPMTELDIPSSHADITRESSRDLFTRFVKQLTWDIKHTDSFACVLFVAARLETLDLPELSIWVYGYLLRRNYSPITQLSNLMRVGGTQHIAAFYHIGKYIINNSTDKILYDHLVTYLKQFINLTKKPSTYMRLFDFSRKYDFIDLGSICLTIAFDFSQDEIIMLNAAILLSELFHMNGIEKNLKPSPGNSCHVLNVLYEDCSNTKIKERILAQLRKLHHEHPSNLFVEITLAYVLGLSQFVNESKTINIDIINEAYGHFSSVYKSLPEFVVEDAVMVSLRDKLYLISVKLLSISKVNKSFRPEFQMIAVDLLNRSANLGSCSSLRHLALMQCAQRENPNNVSDNIAEKAHFENAIEAAIVALDLKTFELNIEDYAKCTAMPDDAKVNSYAMRLDGLRCNLESLKLYERIKKRSITLNAMLKFTSIFQGDDEQKQLEELSIRSPLAIALLWDCNKKKSESLLNEIIRRGMLDHAPAFQTHLIRFLTDYYILARKNKYGVILFHCLRDSLINPNQLGIDACSRVVRTSILVDFYINMIDANLQGCESLINQSPNDCKEAFQSICQTRLILMSTYNHIKSYIQHRVDEVPDFHSNTHQISN